jgi:hypothetical protein
MAVSWTDPQSPDQPNLVQLNNFSACVDLIEVVFANFHSLPLADYIGIPFTIFTQLRLCLGMLLHLSTMDCPGWDKINVRRQVDVLAVADQMVSNFLKASVLYSDHDEESARDNPLARIASHLGHMRNAITAKIRQSDSEGIASTLTPTSAGDLCMIELPDMADFLDLDWLAGVI